MDWTSGLKTLLSLLRAQVQYLGWETEISQASRPKTNKQKSLLILPFQKREHFPSSAGNAFSLELMFFYFP